MVVQSRLFVKTEYFQRNMVKLQACSNQGEENEQIYLSDIPPYLLESLEKDEEAHYDSET